MFRPRFILADPTGCGKTIESLVAFAQLKVKRPNIRLLVITKASAVLQWVEAAQTFLTGVSVTPVNGSASTRMAQYVDDTVDDILVTSWGAAVRDVDTIVEQPWIGDTFVIFDEIATKARNWRQKVYWPNCRRLSLAARYAWGLTATPTYGTWLDGLYSIFEIIRPGTFGPYTDFAATYYERELKQLRLRGGIRRFWEINGLKNQGQLKRVIAPFLLKRPAAQITQYLPKLTPPRLVQIPMASGHREVYERIVDRWFPDKEMALGERRLDPIAAVTYAQMASDAPETVDEDWTGTNAKLDELVRFLHEEAGDEKVIVFTRSTKVLAVIKARLTAEGVSSVRITGDDNQAARHEAQTAFLTGTPQVMLITTAGGEAVNLQAARIVVFYTLPWTWEEYVQVLGRSRRMGASFPEVFPVVLLHEDSIDEATIPLIRKRKSLAEDTVGLDADESLQFEGTAAEPVASPEGVSHEVSGQLDLKHCLNCVVSKEGAESKKTVNTTPSTESPIGEQHQHHPADASHAAAYLVDALKRRRSLPSSRSLK